MGEKEALRRIASLPPSGSFFNEKMLRRSCGAHGAGAVVLISDYAGIHLAALNEPLVGIRGFMIALAIYFTPNVLGTWLAVSLAGRLKERLSK